MSASKGDTTSRNSRTVLIADDSERVRQSLSRMISCLPHLSLIGEARNGREALAAIRERRPDLVVLDVDMPEMTGLEVLEAMKAEGLGSKTIMFTGQAEEAYRQRCVDLGAAHFFEKATQLDEFLAVLKEL